MDKDGSSVAGSVSTNTNQRTSRRPSRLDGNRRTPVGSITSGQSPKVAAAAKHPVLLQTINKLEAEQEVRAYELASLRTLVLKVEKEREDALARARQLEEENHQLHEEVHRLGEEVEALHQDRNTWKVGQWLETAKGLSHVRAAGTANPKPDVPADAANSADLGNGEAAQNRSRSPYRKHAVSRHSNEAHSARTQRSSAQGLGISGLLPASQGWPVPSKDAVPISPPPAPKPRSSAPNRAASVPKERPGLIERNLSYAGSKTHGVPDSNGAKERVPSSSWLPGVLNANSMPNLAASLPELQGALAKLTADREEQAALRQVEVQQLKYTHQQQMKDKEDQLGILSEQVQNAARRIEELQSLLALEPSAHDRSMSVLSPTQSVSQSEQNIDSRVPPSSKYNVLQATNVRDALIKPTVSTCSNCQEQKVDLMRLHDEVQELQQNIAEKQIQNEAITRTAADLTSQLKMSQEQLSDSQQQVHTAVKSAADSAAQLAALRNHLDNVEETKAENAALQAELQKARDLLAAEKQQAESVRSQLEASQVEHVESQQKLLATQKALAAAMSALEAAQAQSFEQSAKTAAAMMETASVRAQYDQAIADLAESQAKSVAMQSQMNQNTQTIQGLQEQLQAMEQQLAEEQASADLAEQSAIDMMANMQKVIDEKKDALLQSQKQVQELINQLDDLQGADEDKAGNQELHANEELERRLQDALEQIASMQSSLASSEGVGMQMMAERLKLQTELEKAHADVARYAADKTAAEEKAEACNLGRQAVEKQLTESNLAAQALEKRLQETDMAKQTAEGLLEDSTAALQSVQLQLGAALLRQSEKEQLSTNLQSEVNSLKKRCNTAMQELEQAGKSMSKMRLERAEIMGLWGASAARARQLFGNVNTLETQAAANTARSEEMQKQLNCKSEEISRLTSELAGLKATLEGLQSQLQKSSDAGGGVSSSLPGFEHSSPHDTLRRQIATLQVDKQQLSLQVDLQISELKALRQQQQQQQQYQAVTDDSSSRGQVEVLEQQLLETQIQLSGSSKQLLEALHSRDEADYIATQAQEQANKANQKVVELKARINTMQNLIRDMASQLSALQAQLRLQRNTNVTSSMEKDIKLISALRPDSPATRSSQEGAHRDEPPTVSCRFFSPQPPSPVNLNQKTTNNGGGHRHRAQAAQIGQLAVSQVTSSQPHQTDTWPAPGQDKQWDATINVKLRQSCPATETAVEVPDSVVSNSATIHPPSRAEAQDQPSRAAALSQQARETQEKEHQRASNEQQLCASAVHSMGLQIVLTSIEALYKRLRSITALYGLDVGAMVRRNATPMQLWNALYATIAALESRALTSTARASSQDHNTEHVGRLVQREQLLLGSNKEKLRPTSAPHQAGKLGTHR